MSSLYRKYTICFVGVVCFLFSGADAAEPLIAQQLSVLNDIELEMAKGRVDLARESFRHRVREAPQDNILRLYEAWCDLPSIAAWEAIKGIATVSPEFPWAFYGMGRIYQSWNMKVPSKESHLQALRLEPRFFPSSIALGDLAREEGRREEARSRYEYALALHDDALAHEGLGMLFLDEGDLESSMIELKKALDLWPKNPRVLKALFDMERRRGNLGAAVGFLEKLVSLELGDPWALHQLAEAYLELGQRDDAVRAFERLRRLRPSEEDILAPLAMLYRQTGKSEAEEELVSVWSKARPENLQPLLRWIQLAELRGDWPLVEKLWISALKVRRESHFCVELSRVLERQEKFIEAFENLSQCRQLAATDVFKALKEQSVFRQRLGLAPQPLSGKATSVMQAIQTSAGRVYQQLAKEGRVLNGRLRLSVEIDRSGKAQKLEWLEDSFSSPTLRGHVMLSIHEARFPKAMARAEFQFDAGKVSKP